MEICADAKPPTEEISVLRYLQIGHIIRVCVAVIFSSSMTKSDPVSAISEAIRAKRDRKFGGTQELEALEASLLADIENFDIDAEERRARIEYLANTSQTLADPTLVFPEITTTGAAGASQPLQSSPAVASAKQETLQQLPVVNGSLLDQLREQAESQQRKKSVAQSERTLAKEAIDRTLKQAFSYLHELVQQLNIVKPEIPRDYPLVEQVQLKQLSWQEGFADYRTQSQSSGALVELVTFSYRLTGQGSLYVEREGTSVERFRTMLFDFGLPFNCKEFKNERGYVERAEFDIPAELSVSTRWRADFSNGFIVVEARNIERLGGTNYVLRPQAVDQALLEDFGRLVIGQSNRFRELAKR